MTLQTQDHKTWIKMKGLQNIWMETVPEQEKPFVLKVNDSSGKEYVLGSFFLEEQIWFLEKWIWKVMDIAEERGVFKIPKAVRKLEDIDF